MTRSDARVSRFNSIPKTYQAPGFRLKPATSAPPPGRRFRHVLPPCRGEPGAETAPAWLRLMTGDLDDAVEPGIYFIPEPQSADGGGP